MLRGNANMRHKSAFRGRGQIFSSPGGISSRPVCLLYSRSRSSLLSVCGVLASGSPRCVKGECVQSRSGECAVNWNQGMRAYTRTLIVNSYVPVFVSDSLSRSLGCTFSPLSSGALVYSPER